MKTFHELELGDAFLAVEADIRAIKISATQMFVLNRTFACSVQNIDSDSEVIKVGRVAIAAAGITTTF